MENKSEPKNSGDENSEKINAKAQLIKGFQIALYDGALTVW
jgi:hypothetical protein